MLQLGVACVHWMGDPLLGGSFFYLYCGERKNEWSQIMESTKKFVCIHLVIQTNS